VYVYLPYWAVWLVLHPVEELGGSRGASAVFVAVDCGDLVIRGLDEQKHLPGIPEVLNDALLFCQDK